MWKYYINYADLINKEERENIKSDVHVSIVKLTALEYFTRLKIWNFSIIWVHAILMKKA